MHNRQVSLVSIVLPALLAALIMTALTSEFFLFSLSEVGGMTPPSVIARNVSDSERSTPDAEYTRLRLRGENKKQ